MKTFESLETAELTVIKPDQLIGTKWDSWCEPYRGRISMEFVDKNICVYTSDPKEYPMKYTVTDGKVFINYIEGPFELGGDVLFNNNLPVFERAA